MTDPIATLIRTERQRRAQTQAETAAEMRVCQTSVSSWERGETVPAFRLRGRVARWLRMTAHNVTDACLVGLAEMKNNNEREVEMGEKTKVMTTEELRERTAEARADGQDATLPTSSQRHSQGAYKAYRRCLPIAEERDALRAEVERLRAMLSVPDGVERHRGGKSYRFAEHPRERRLSDAWHDENTREGCGAGLLAWVLGDGNKPASISARDEYVAASVVQWLGTPVGASFLHDIGYRFDRGTQ